MSMSRDARGGRDESLCSSPEEEDIRPLIGDRVRRPCIVSGWVREGGERKMPPPLAPPLGMIVLWNKMGLIMDIRGHDSASICNKIGILSNLVAAKS